MDDRDRTVLTRFFIGIAIVIAIIVLVWLFVIRNNSKKDPAEPTSKTTTAKEEPAPKSSPATPNSAPSSGSGQGAQNSSSQNKPAVAGQQLADAGPGETALVFVAAVIGGTVVHRLYRRHATHSQAN